MSKVSIWCCKDYDKGIEAFEVWSGDMGHIPSENDYLVIFGGWSMERVLRTCYNLYDGTVIIEINPDYTGGYAAEVKKRRGAEA